MKFLLKFYYYFVGELCDFVLFYNYIVYIVYWKKYEVRGSRILVYFIELLRDYWDLC